MRVRREVGVDAVDRQARAHALQDQVRRAALDGEIVRPLEVAADLEAELARRPAEDLEELLLRLGAQRGRDLVLREQIHGDQDLPLELPALHALARFGELRRRDPPGAHQMVAEALVHEIRANRDRVTVVQAQPLALALVAQVQHAGGAQPVEVVEQRRERELIEAAGEIRLGACGRGCGGTRRRLRRPTELARHHREQRLERDGLAQQPGCPQRLGATRVLGRRRAARNQHDRQIAGRRRQGAQRLQHGEAIALGKHQVEQHEIRGGAADRLERELAVVGRRHPVAFAPQGLGQDLAEIPIVIDAEDASAHHRPPNRAHRPDRWGGLEGNSTRKPGQVGAPGHAGRSDGPRGPTGGRAPPCEAGRRAHRPALARCPGRGPARASRPAGSARGRRSCAPPRG